LEQSHTSRPRSHEFLVPDDLLGDSATRVSVRSVVRLQTQASILEHLTRVAAERDRRAARPQLQAAVQALKKYQQLRFTRTYADLLDTQRYGQASRFFLDELYGPSDFSQRDTQFSRVVPAMVRVLPTELVQTLDLLAQLHSISEALDSEMGSHLSKPHVDAWAYLHAWQATGKPAQREAQIALTVAVGASLDHYTHKPLLRQTLRLMRRPARSAGFGEMQHFLETGFDAFKAMDGADAFLGLIGKRERELAQALFSTRLSQAPTHGDPVDSATGSALQYLP
jgi:hypothetical protein